MKRTEDGDEVFTFRRPERSNPSCKLEEVVSANILRAAKENFSARHLGETPPSPARVKVKLEPLSSENESLPSDEEDSEDEVSGSQSKRGTRAAVTTLKPAVATDDDVSYELIRPSARAILDKLDQTLSILHNARMTSAQNLMEDSDSSSEDHDAAEYQSRPTSRASSGRPRSRSISRVSATGGNTPAPTETKKSNRGRKPKWVQMEGESMQDFLLRRARAQKKKQPVILEDADGDEASATSAAEAPRSPRRRGRRRTRRRESMTEDGEYWMQKKLERLNLRDWSDVMGAAALAGFSPKVIARATQRCANLFGQGMDIHTINETAGSSGVNGIKTRRYEPGATAPPSSSGSEDEDEDPDTRQARSMARRAGLVPGRAISSALSDGGDAKTQLPKKRQKRSSSGGPATGLNYCPHAGCSRAVKGFDRPYNLKRHLNLVHHGQDSAEAEEVVAEAVKTGPVEDDGLDGGVHRDGFLEPVRIHKGWRAEDTRKRATKKSTGKRQRDESSGDEDEDEESGDDDSEESESETQSDNEG